MNVDIFHLEKSEWIAASHVHVAGCGSRRVPGCLIQI